MTTVDYMDLGQRPAGIQVRVTHTGGSAYVEIVNDLNYRQLAANAPYNCVYSEYLSNGQFTYTLPGDDHWYVVAVGQDGTLDIDLLVPNRPAVPYWAPGASGEFNLPSDPTPRHNRPAPPPAAPNPLRQLLNHKPAAQQGMSWSDFVQPEVGLAQQYIDQLRHHFFLDDVSPVSYEVAPNLDGSMSVEIRMSDGSTLKLTLGRKFNTLPIPGGPSISVENPNKQPQAFVKDSPLFGSAYLYPEDGTYYLEKQPLIDLMEGADIVSNFAMAIPDINAVAGIAKVSLSAIKRMGFKEALKALKAGRLGKDVKKAYEDEIERQLKQKKNDTPDPNTAKPKTPPMQTKKVQSGSPGKWNAELNNPLPNTRYEVDNGKFIFETDANGLTKRRVPFKRAAGAQTPSERRRSSWPVARRPTGASRTSRRRGPGENINLTA